MVEGLVPNLMSGIQEFFADELKKCGDLKLMMTRWIWATWTRTTAANGLSRKSLSTSTTNN
eukprot:1446119-Prorocentrum_lima.AAC.1